MESLTEPRWSEVMTTNLIIGGTGKTGRRVASRLQDRGLPVTSLSRPEFDWADPTTWSSVEQPAETAYVTYYPDLAIPGAPEAVAEVVERMARSGVRRFVLLSGRGEPEAQRAEEKLAEVAERYGADWGVVRCAFFMQNFDESLFAESARGRPPRLLGRRRPRALPRPRGRRRGRRRDAGGRGPRPTGSTSSPAPSC